MGRRKRKSLTGPIVSSTHGSKAAITSVTRASQLRAAILQPPPTNGHAADPADTVTAPPPPTPPTDGLSKRPTPRPGSWDPWTRYWSSRNPFPEYENDSTTTMAKFVRSVGQMFIGNNLSGEVARPAAQSPTITAKRPGTSDSNSLKPHKRRRTDEDVQDLRSVSSSSDLREQPRPVTSPVRRRHSRGSTSLRSTSPVAKKGPRDSQSLISSGDRQSKGLEVNEYRTITRFTDAKGGSRKRSRHSKRGSQLGNGHTQQAQESLPHGEKTSQGGPHRHHRRLIQHKEILDDPIQDDDIEIVAETRAPKQKRANPSHFTGSRFGAPGDATSSEEEERSDPEQDEITEVPAPKQHEPAARRPEGQQVLGKTKRPAVSPGEQQPQRAPKRRADQADALRTNSVSNPTFDSRSRNCGDCVLKIKGAVCEPCFVFPAQDGMHRYAFGACNKTCALSHKGDDKRTFRPVDGFFLELKELAWMTPDLSKVTRIWYNEESTIVRLKKMMDNRPESSGGPVLLIKFGGKEDAKRYVELCRGANENIDTDDSTDAEMLERIFTNKRDLVKERNMRRPGPLFPDTELLSPTEGMNERSGKPAQLRARPVVEANEPSGNNVQRKTMRTQMKGDNESRIDTPMAKDKSQQRKIITPAEERQLRSLLHEDDSRDGKEEDNFLSERIQDRASLQSLRIATTRPQRSLRSSQPAVPVSPPPPERWTQKNPDWVRLQNWVIPLVFERTTVNCGDIACLDEGQFLNDAIISFYAKYLHHELEKKDKHLAKKVYIFNSFFWETLRAKGYDGVKNWTAKVDLLAYDYIVVPINQHAHWYLAIVCNPGALIPKEEPEEDVQEISNEHNGHDGALSDTAAEAKVATVTSDLSQVSIEDHPDKSPAIELDGFNGAPSAKKSKASKRRVPPRKYDPKAPRVITLDSLDGTHSAVASNLKAYLIREIKERKDLDIEAPLSFGTTAKDIPMQDNFTDCGVYLLGYVEEFMKDPHRFARRILQQEKRDWDVNAPALRNKIRKLIFDLQKDKQQDELRRRREKKLLSSQKQAKTQTPATTVQRPTNSAVDSEQDTRKASRSPAVDRQNTPRAASSPVDYVNGNSNGRRAESKTSNSKSPTPRAQAPSPIPSPQIKENEFPSMNESMIVNPNDSIELDNERKQDGADRAPRIRKSAQIGTDPICKTPGPKISPGSRQVSESRQASEARQMPRGRSARGEFDERSFLPQLDSSPSTSPAPTSRESVERKGASSATKPSKHTTPKQQDQTRSPYFTSSMVEPSSARAIYPARRDRTEHHVYHAVNSSDVDEVETSRRKPKRKKSSPPGPTIDLTDDN